MSKVSGISAFKYHLQGAIGTCLLTTQTFQALCNPLNNIVFSELTKHRCM